MTAMNTLRSQPTYVKIAAAATVAVGAAAVYHEHERRKTEKSKKSTTEKKKSKEDSSPDKSKKSKKSSSKSPEMKRKSKSSSSEKTKTKPESTDKSVEPIATPAAPEPKATTGNKKVVVLISSYGGNIQIKTNQERAFTILKGMKVEGDQLEIVDGAKAPNREKRNELFGVSGIRAKYPQFFVVDQTDKTHFVANWEDFEAMNDMGCLKQTLNIAA